MIKKLVTEYLQDESGEIIEHEKKVYLFYSPMALRNYESLTGRKMMDDLKKATNKASEVEKLARSVENIEDNIDSFMGTFTDTELNEFILNFCIATYAEFINGRFASNEATMEVAKESMWVSEIANFSLMGEIITTITSGLSSKKK
ncbi:MAG: hypothetical protein LBH89_02395 [Lactococcus lactis]|jgi:hypothetical protein|nr:hypothetical protein [Lactococcus lactis]